MPDMGVLYNGVPLLNSEGVPVYYDGAGDPPASCCCATGVCPCFPGPVPAVWEVTIDNVGDAGRVDGCCEGHNATFAVPQEINGENGEPSPCNWVLSYMACEQTNVRVSITCGGSGVTVQVFIEAPTDTAEFRKTFPPGSLPSDIVGDIPLVAGGPANCDFSAATCSIAPG